MQRIVELKKEDRKFIFDKTSLKLNIHPAIIEKDFWICYVLDILFNKSKYKNVLTFKGGTSLSKAYNIISRMSEDIDLVLNWEILNINKEEPFIIRSKRQQEIYNNKLDNLTARFLENEFYFELKDKLKNIDNLKVEVIPNEQIINIYYPQTYNHENVGILPCIKLEIGTLASWEPADTMIITPYINNVIDGYDNIFIKTRVISVIRTFYEKIAILHREANRVENKKMPLRYARHYYDVYKIYKSKYFNKILENVSVLEDVIKYKQKFYYDNWSNLGEIIKGNVILIPPKYRFKEIENDYKSMKEMLIGEVPTMEEIMITLFELQKILNNNIKYIKICSNHTY